MTRPTGVKGSSFPRALTFKLLILATGIGSLIYFGLLKTGANEIPNWYSSKPFWELLAAVGILLFGSVAMVGTWKLGEILADRFPGRWVTNSPIPVLLLRLFIICLVFWAFDATDIKSLLGVFVGLFLGITVGSVCGSR